MDRAERPSALLGRLSRVSPLVTRAVVAAVVIGLVVTVAVIAQAVALATLLAALFHDRRAPIGADLGWFLAATLLRSLAVGLGEPATARIAAPIRRDLRLLAMRHVLERGPFDTFDGTVQLATRGVDAIENYLARYVPSLILAALAPVLLLAWLATHDLLSGVIVFISVLLLPVFMILLGLEARGKMQERWREQQRLASYFGDVVRGITVLKSFNRSTEAVANLDEVGASLGRSTMSTLRVAFLSGFALELLSSLATALVALVLGLRLLNGSIGLNVALTVLLLTPEVFLPLRRSAAQYHASSEGIAAAADLLAHLDVDVPTGSRKVPNVEPRIVLEGVDIGHAGRSGGGVKLDATIDAGSLLLVTGPSGSGKTTLLRAIAGLGAPVSGRITIDGVDLRELSPSEWHARVAWLPQDPSLPGDTVRDVVQMGDEGIDDLRIMAAMNAVGLEIELDLPLGEGSKELSAGQRRRLALVRCLVRDPVLLLLDEPTAHLDPENARLVGEAIGRLTMTRIVATHQVIESDHVIEMRADVRHAV